MFIMCKRFFLLCFLISGAKVLLFFNLTKKNGDFQCILIIFYTFGSCLLAFVSRYSPNMRAASSTIFTQGRFL